MAGKSGSSSPAAGGASTFSSISGSSGMPSRISPSGREPARVAAVPDAEAVPGAETAPGAAPLRPPPPAAAAPPEGFAGEPAGPAVPRGPAAGRPGAPGPGAGSGWPAWPDWRWASISTIFILLRTSLRPIEAPGGGGNLAARALRRKRMAGVGGCQPNRRRLAGRRPDGGDRKHPSPLEGGRGEGLGGVEGGGRLGAPAQRWGIQRRLVQGTRAPASGLSAASSAAESRRTLQTGRGRRAVVGSQPRSRKADSSQQPRVRRAAFTGSL